jgi:hypothetical protein
MMIRRSPESLCSATLEAEGRTKEGISQENLVPVLRVLQDKGTQRVLDKSEVDLHEVGPSDKRVCVLSELGDAAYLKALDLCLVVGEKSPTAKTVHVKYQGGFERFWKINKELAFAFIQLPEPIKDQRGETVLTTNILAALILDPERKVVSGITILDPEAKTTDVEALPLRTLVDSSEKATKLEALLATRATPMFETLSLRSVNLAPEEKQALDVPVIRGGQAIAIWDESEKPHLVPTRTFSLHWIFPGLKRLTRATLTPTYSPKVAGGKREELKRILLGHIKTLAVFDLRQQDTILTTRPFDFESYIQKRLTSENRDLEHLLRSQFQKALRGTRGKGGTRAYVSRGFGDEGKRLSLLAVLPPGLRDSLSEGSREQAIEQVATYLAVKGVVQGKNRLRRYFFQDAK